VLWSVLPSQWLLFVYQSSYDYAQQSSGLHLSWPVIDQLLIPSPMCTQVVLLEHGAVEWTHLHSVLDLSFFSDAAAAPWHGGRHLCRPLSDFADVWLLGA
jgi:hypothetical protein